MSSLTESRIQMSNVDWLDQVMVESSRSRQYLVVCLAITSQCYEYSTSIVRHGMQLPYELVAIEMGKPISSIYRSCGFS